MRCVRWAMLAGVVVGALGCDHDVVLPPGGGYSGPPNAFIYSPQDETSFVLGDPVELAGVVSSSRGLASLEVYWWSSLDDLLSGPDTPMDNGEVHLIAEHLSLGAHTIRLLATDELGYERWDEIVVHVEEIPAL